MLSYGSQYLQNVIYMLNLINLKRFRPIFLYEQWVELLYVMWKRSVVVMRPWPISSQTETWMNCECAYNQSLIPIVCLGNSFTFAFIFNHLTWQFKFFFSSFKIQSLQEWFYYSVWIFSNEHVHACTIGVGWGTIISVLSIPTERTLNTMDVINKALSLQLFRKERLSLRHNS